MPKVEKRPRCRVCSLPASALAHAHVLTFFWPPDSFRERRTGPLNPCASTPTTGKSFILPQTAGIKDAGTTRTADAAAERTRMSLEHGSPLRQSARTRQCKHLLALPHTLLRHGRLSAMREGVREAERGRGGEGIEGGILMRLRDSYAARELLFLPLLAGTQSARSHFNLSGQVRKNSGNGWSDGGMSSVQVGGGRRERNRGDGAGVLRGSVACCPRSAGSPGVWARRALRVQAQGLLLPRHPAGQCMHPLPPSHVPTAHSRHRDHVIPTSPPPLPGLVPMAASGWGGDVGCPCAKSMRDLSDWSQRQGRRACAHTCSELD